MRRRYVPGAGVDETLVSYENYGTSNEWLIADRQGSVIAAANAGGLNIYRYGPYGEPGGEGWSGTRIRYTGQIALPEAGLYHYKARVYDPLLGRFLQTDPVVIRQDSTCMRTWRMIHLTQMIRWARVAKIMKTLSRIRINASAIGTMPRRPRARDKRVLPLAVRLRSKHTTRLSEAENTQLILKQCKCSEQST